MRPILSLLPACRLVKRNVYGVWSRDLFADAAVVEGLPPQLPPRTLLGVSSLAWPGMMVEVEVTAAVPAR